MKNKFIIIAIAIVLVITILVGAIAAIALGGSYLKSMKDRDFAQEVTFNGIEIVEDDGLFYLTRDGKKISKHGYETLVSVAESAEDYSAEKFLALEDFEIFDYFVATKENSDNYFLVDGEGNEIKIENDGLVYAGAQLPFLRFVDPITTEQTFISLKELNSDLSECADGVLKIKNTYFRASVVKDKEDDYQYLYVLLCNDDTAIDSPTFTYVGQNGKILFTSLETEAREYRLEKEDGSYARYFQLSDKRFVALDGTVIATDVMYVEDTNDYIQISAGDYEKPDEMKVVFVSPKATVTLSAAEYDFNNAEVRGALVNIALKNSTEYKTFNVVTGEAFTGCNNLVQVAEMGDSGLLRMQLTAEAGKYVYFDKKTGAELYRSTYADMVYYTDGVIWSPSEFAARADGKTPLHFVAPGKTAADTVLDTTEAISARTYEGECVAYDVVSTKLDPVNAVNVIKHAILQVTAEGVTKTALYDTIEYVDLFANGAPVAIAKDYAEGKVDFIDPITASVVYTVEAEGAQMAKLNISYCGTTAVVANNTSKEAVVEVATLNVKFNNDAGEIEKTTLIALSRGAVMTEDGELVTAALNVAELSTNPFPYEAVIATDKGESYYDFSKYLAVRNADKTSVVYTLDESLKLTRVGSVPYLVMDIRSYGDNLDNAYLEVTNESELVGAYTVDGNQLLPITHDSIQICGDFAIAVKKGAYGMYKINYKKNTAKLVLDFKFDEIDHVFGDAFIVEETDGEYYLYEGGDLVKKDHIAGDYLTGFNISIDEETGKLLSYNYLVVNLDGRLYIHRDEPTELTFTYAFVAYPWSGKGDIDITNDDVIAVNFRNADGSLIETRVVYDTALSKLKFEMLEGEWHSTGVKDLQSSATVVTRDEILYKSGVVDLYKAHAKD